MPRDFLHNHPQFSDLIRIVANNEGIAPALVEKDYWIMQSLYGLQQLELAFQLKGGTSLSKGYGLISRFSEDIDIRIEPPAAPPALTTPYPDTRSCAVARWPARTGAATGAMPIWRSSACPASVSATVRVVRLTSRTPSLPSSERNE